MPGPHLTAPEAAEELGRSLSWLYDNHKRLQRAHAMPAPLHDGASPLVWSRAQFYAWLDRPLPPAVRLAAQAYRAAAAAAASAPHVAHDQLATEEWTRRLEGAFAGEKA